MFGLLLTFEGTVALLEIAAKPSRNGCAAFLASQRHFADVDHVRRCEMIGLRDVDDVARTVDDNIIAGSDANAKLPTPRMVRSFQPNLRTGHPMV
jgi:hypothetical protein